MGKQADRQTKTGRSSQQEDLDRQIETGRYADRQTDRQKDKQVGS